MDEPPELHDFDQRHDGPFDQPRASATLPRASLNIPRQHSTSNGSHSPPRAASTSRVNTTGSSKSAPSSLPRTTPSNADPMPLPRKSMQLPGRASVEVEGRKSTATSRLQPGRDGPYGRPSLATSRDFDNRRDGPYGRPSLAMSRRKSSTPGITSTEATVAASDEVAPTSTADPADSDTVAFEPEPPPLNYSLWARRWAIVIFWSLIVVDCIAMPIALYFSLWYATDLSPNIVFSIVTAALGGVSIMEYFVRFWRLFKKNSVCRVIGARRMYLDWFHWNFTLGWAIIMIELIVGTIPEDPPIRLLSMPVATMLFVFGTELLLVDALRLFEIPAPVRISSIPKGAQLRPAIYSIIEDVCAVDGSGGTAFREALNRRYEASHVFRAMLRRLGAFWAFGAQGIAIVVTILIFTIQHEAAYVVGWSVPFIWAGVWALITYYYVKKKLAEEKQAWAAEIAEKQGASV